MSIGLVRKNSNSPFHLQRSFVDQGGRGDSYESGGYNPNTIYSNGIIDSAIASIGDTVGSYLSSRTPGDINKSDIKKKQSLENRENRLADKRDKLNKPSDTFKASRLDKRLGRISERKNEVNSKIEKYNSLIK